MGQPIWLSAWPDSRIPPCTSPPFLSLSPSPLLFFLCFPFPLLSLSHSLSFVIVVLASLCHLLLRHGVVLPHLPPPSSRPPRPPDCATAPSSPSPFLSSVFLPPSLPPSLLLFLPLLSISPSLFTSSPPSLGSNRLLGGGVSGESRMGYRLHRLQ